ncbi:MAG TPA: glycosyltransferase [Anaerolineae bacterium]
MHSPRILILHASTGAGHRRAAEAVKAALQARNATVEVIDSVRHIHPLFKLVYVQGGLGMITRMPRVFGALYRMADRPLVDRLMRLPRYSAQRLSARSLLREVRRCSPEAILCTHFLPVELLAAWRRQGRLAQRLYAVITDFEPHRIWEHAGIDAYFVASDYAAQRLFDDGIPRDVVHVTGIPILLDFTRHYDRIALKTRLGFDPDRPLILATGGGLGAGSMEAIAREALHRSAGPPAEQFAFVTGNNADLRARLDQLLIGTGWRALGYVSNMPEWLAAADIAIGKAGGMTGSEILASGVPFVIPPGVKGHEDRNAVYLQACGAAVVTATIAEAVHTALSIVRDPNRREQMRMAARIAARPRAAHAIASVVLRELE